MDINPRSKNHLRIQLSDGGLELSRIVAGVMRWGDWGYQFKVQQYISKIEKCLEIGVTTFDHADIYGGFTTEADFGKALKLKPSLREKMELVTKCGIRMMSENRPENKIKSYDTSKSYILKSVENSLKNFHTDYIDLLLIHRPSPLMSPTEIAEAFSILKTSGKVLHFGVSNFTPSQFEMLNQFFPLATNQIEISILHRTPFLEGALDQCISKKIKPMAWSPFGGGQFFQKEKNEQILRIEKIAFALGKKYNASVDQVLLSFLLKHPSEILPVLGTGKVERIRAAVQALELELTGEEWFELWTAATGKAIP